MNIVLAHDYITQRGGAERVALAIAEGLNVSRIITSIYDPAHTFEAFGNFEIVSSRISEVPFFRRDPRRALPILAAAWSAFPPVEADVVVCSSSGWAHGLRVHPSTAKIVYCHNPARWLYQRAEYLEGKSRLTGLALQAIGPYLRKWDQTAASTASLYIANSTVVRERIRTNYGIDAEILYPPVTLPMDILIDMKTVKQPYFLTVGRDRGYKGTSLICEAFRQLPDSRLVIVGLSKLENCPPNIIPLGRVEDSELAWLYSHATALVSVSKEDFGLTPLEANAFGTPTLLIREGGFLDSTVEGVSGMFIEARSPDAIRQSVELFPNTWNRTKIIEHAGNFSVENFIIRLKALIDIAVCDCRK